jgi:hypothetical protein
MTDLDKSPAVPFDLVTRGPTIGPTKNYNPASGTNPGGVNGNIQWNNAGAFDGLTDVQITARIQLFTTTLSGAVPAPGSIAGKVLSDSGAWVPQTGGGGSTPGGVNGNIQFNSAGSFGGLTDVQVTARIQQFSTTLSGAVPASGAATGTHFLRDDNIWAIPAGGGGGSPGGSNLQVQYNNAGAFGGYTNVQLTALIQPFTSSLSGAVPASAGGTLNFLRSDATWANTLGSVGGGTGVINLAGNTSGMVSIQPQDAAGSYIFALPSSAGTAGQLLQGQGGAGLPMFWTYTPTLGAAGFTTGALKFAGSGSGVVTVQAQSAAGTYNLNLPTSAGTTGQGLTSGGGGGAAMTWSNFVVSTAIPSVKGGYPVWSDTTGLSVSDGQGIINARAYGVDPGNSATTNTTNLQAALNTGKRVYLPIGQYNVNNTLTLSTSGGGLIGDGWWTGGTGLNMTIGTNDVLQIPDGVFGIEIGNMYITRPSPATSGAGVNFVSGTTGNDHARVHDLRVFNQQDGLRLGGVSWGYAWNILAISNSRHGVSLVGTASVPMQWQLHNILSEANTSDGFHMVGAGTTPVGQWGRLSTNANTGYGFFSSGIAALRLSDSFFGGDCVTLGHEVYISSGDATHPHTLTNVYIEGAVKGAGFYFDSGATAITLVNCISVNNWLSGLINNSGKNVSIGGGAFLGNGIGVVAGNTYGVLNLAASSTMSLTGAQALVSGAQTFGILASAGTGQISIVACNAPAGAVSIAGGVTNYQAGNY